MTQKSEIIAERSSQIPDESAGSYRRNLLEITVAFLLVMAAVWTPAGRLNSFLSTSAAACVLAFAISGRWSSREMGLSRPFTGAGKILLAGAALCGAIWLAGVSLKHAGPAYAIPWSRSWQYAIWAVVQQFILQSIFFVRLEPMIGSDRTILAVTALYAIAHIPNPVLTVLSFIGGIVFCEMFCRWRNIFPIGTIHAALGLTIAASFPDRWLHHMRVGIGYLAAR